MCYKEIDSNSEVMPKPKGNLTGNKSQQNTTKHKQCVSFLGNTILGLRPVNERRRYFVTTSLIGWVQA